MADVMAKGLTYKDAGVDIDAGDELVRRIKPFVAATRKPWCNADIGGFSGFSAIPAGYQEPLLVSGTDGVGTKLAVAIEADDHSTIGEDLVAMCVNDILTSGAKPLFFLDYFATSKLDVTRAASVIEGIARGCQKAECALVGGETAEMPGFYPEGHYDLAGFAVGIVERRERLGPERVQNGDALIGIASSGLHSNGFSLARRVLLEHAKLNLDSELDGKPLKAWLLEPTRIYTPQLHTLLKHGTALHALCHVTGGGIVGNLPRVIPKTLCAELNITSWVTPAIFTHIQTLGEVPSDEMWRVFNMGLGLIASVERAQADAVLASLNALGKQAWYVGRVRERKLHDPAMALVSE